MPYTPITLTGTVLDSSGNPSSASGRIYFTLSSDGTSISGGFSIAGSSAISQALVNGVITGTLQVTGNDDITPSGTFYKYEAMDLNGNIIARRNVSILLSNGASQNISSLTPPAVPFAAGTGTPSVRLVNTTSPLTGGGDLTADRTFTLSTSPGGAGTLVGTGRTLTATSPLTGGGDLSADRSFGIQTASDTVAGALSASDHQQIDTTVIWANKKATGGAGTSASPYTGWDTAIDWTKSNQVVRFPQLGGGAAAYYQTATAGFTVSGVHNWLIGDGANLSILVLPTQSADGAVMVTWYTGAATELVQCGMKGFNFKSPDTTHTKTAVKTRDVGAFTMSDCAIIDGDWTGNTSIGWDSRGREFIWVDRCYLFADKPIALNKNDGASGSTISFDHSHVKDCSLVPSNASSNYAITVQDGVYFTDSTFRDIAVSRGAGFITWTDTTSAAASNSIVIDTVRQEQATAGTTYIIDLESTGKQLQGFTIRNVYGGSGIRGIKLRSAATGWGVIDNFSYIGTGVALDFTNSTVITFVGGFRQSGSSVTLGATAQYAAFNTNLVDNTILAGEVMELRGFWKTRQATAPTISAISAGIGATGTVACVAGSTDQAGTILLTYNGAGKAAAVNFQFNFNVTRPNTSYTILLTAFGGNTNYTAPTTVVGTSPNTGNFTILLTNGAIPADGNTFNIGYQVIPYGT